MNNSTYYLENFEFSKDKINLMSAFINIINKIVYNYII